MPVHVQKSDETAAPCRKSSMLHHVAAVLCGLFFLLLGGFINLPAAVNAAEGEPAPVEPAKGIPFLPAIKPARISPAVDSAIEHFWERELGGSLGSALEGEFYDLKMKRSGAPSGLKPSKPNGVIAALAKFFQSGWNEAYLNRFYRSEYRPYASYWYLPVASAKYGPIAFEVGTHTKPESVWECRPSAWLAVYRGTVVAPKNGKFRFIGTGDDVLAVRFNHETVLESGYYAPTAYDKANPEACHLALPAHREAFLNARKGYEMIRSVTGCDKWNRELGGLVAGAEFSVKEGEEYPIEIAIADISGASVGFVLFIEDVTEGKNSQATQYDLFRTCDANPDPAEVFEAILEAGCAEQAEAIPFNADSWVWESVRYEIEGWE